ncbi:AraC family transcriptional regulator [Parafrankia elaeagni]|uniref:AraC family transcriptional regulator n=1 Tax=Parafrankia elaeagni TaxID=222534 RepID=UPI000372D9C2
MEQVDEHVRIAPAAALRPYVAWYSGYRQRGLPPAAHRGLPSPALTLIFTLDEPLVLLTPPTPAARAVPPAPAVPAPSARSFDSLVAGLHMTPALISHQGAQSGVQLALRPLGVRALLGLPAGALAAHDLHAEEVLGTAGRRLSDRLREAPGWPERFAVLDAELARLAWSDRRIDREVRPEIRHAWSLLRHHGGGVAVSTLAAEVGWSTRHLGSRFQAEIGLSPKAAGRVIRFDRARRVLAGWAAGQAARQAAERGTRSSPGCGPRPSLTLADLAAACGYFDQAHLAREFRALAGCTPSGWLAEEFRNVQAGSYGYDEVLDGPGSARPR